MLIPYEEGGALYIKYSISGYPSCGDLEKLGVFSPEIELIKTLVYLCQDFGERDSLLGDCHLQLHLMDSD